MYLIEVKMCHITFHYLFGKVNQGIVGKPKIIKRGIERFLTRRIRNLYTL